MSRWAGEDWMVSQLASPGLLTYKTCWSMHTDAGLWGFGPATFRLAFPLYIKHLGYDFIQNWRFAHEDYLQAVIEWGWIGAGAWAVLFGGGIAAGIFGYWRRGSLLARFDRIFLFTVVLALFGLALHATVDFPLQIPSLQLYAAVYLGIAWGSRSWTRGAIILS